MPPSAVFHMPASAFPGYPSFKRVPIRKSYTPANKKTAETVFRGFPGMFYVTG